MKKMRRWYFLAGLAILAVVLMLAGVVVAVGPWQTNYGALFSNWTKNYVEDHKNSGSIDKATCRGCHPRSNNVLDAHNTHTGASLVDNIEDCGWCHEKTDVSQGENVDISGVQYGELGWGSYEGGSTDNPARKHVDPNRCVQCHGQWTATTPKYGPDSHDSTPTPFKCEDGACHSGGANGEIPSVAHTPATWIDQTYSNSPYYCLKCHGGLAKYQVEETNP